MTSKPTSHNEGSDEDDDKKFSNITAQLAWEKDIDLTKGQAFLKDPSVVENKPPGSPRPTNIEIKSKETGNADSESPGKKTVTETQPPSAIPNGNASRVIKKYVKKPNGTPKASPKVQKQFHMNRVTPLPLYIKEADDDVDFVDSLEEVTQRPLEADVKYQSVLSSSHVGDEEGQSTIKADDRHVSHVYHDTSHGFKTPPRVGSADSRTRYDQWVDELIEASPGTSPGKLSTDSLESKQSKSKTKKKSKKEKKKDKDKTKDSAEKKSESKSKGDKTPTSDDILLVDNPDIDDESVV